MTGAIEYNGSTGRDLYDLADINKAGAPLVYEGVGTADIRGPTRVFGASTRAATAAGRSTTASCSRSTRGESATRAWR